MNTKLAVTITGCLLAFNSAQADTWNADISVGQQKADNLQWDNTARNTDSGDSYGIGVSKQISSKLGLGFEVGYNKSDYTCCVPFSGIASSMTTRYAMLTSQYDFIQQGNFSAYGGLGLGFITAVYKNSDANPTANYRHVDQGPAGKLSLGARYAISPKVKLFFEARHISAFDDLQLAIGSHDAEVKGTSFLLGLRYSY